MIAEIDKKLSRADQRDPAPRGLPEARGRLARPALPRQQHRDRRDAEDPRDEHLQEGARQDAQEATRARPGTRARSSRRSTRRSTASSAASRSAASSATTTSTTARPTSSCSARWRKIAAAAHAPFIAGAAPTLMQMESWQELANPRDLTKIFTTPEYAAWRSLRESEDVALHRPRDAALPRAAALRRQDEPGRGVRLRGRHRAAASTASTPGRTRPTRWPSTSTARSRCTAGARASAASSRAARSRACRRTPSRPTTAAST